MKVGNIKRRDFVKVFGLASGGLLLGCNFSDDKTPVINTLIDGESFVPNCVELKSYVFHFSSQGARWTSTSRS